MVEQIKQSRFVLFYVAVDDIPVIYATAHKCAGGLKKKSKDLWLRQEGQGQYCT